jgi:hypothetical protein
MNVYLLDPTLASQPKYIREGRCTQKAASWATVPPPITLAVLGALAKDLARIRLTAGNVTPLTQGVLLADGTPE